MYDYLFEEIIHLCFDLYAPTANAPFVLMRDIDYTLLLLASNSYINNCTDDFATYVTFTLSSEGWFPNPSEDYKSITMLSVPSVTSDTQSNEDDNVYSCDAL